MPVSEIFLSVFYRIRTEYGDMFIGPEKIRFSTFFIHWYDHTKSYVFMYCVICQETRDIEKKQRKEEIKIIGNEWCPLIWSDIIFYILFKEITA